MCRGVREHELVRAVHLRVQRAGLRNHGKDFFQRRAEGVSGGLVDTELVKCLDISVTVRTELGIAGSADQCQPVTDLNVRASDHDIAVVQLIERLEKGRRSPA